MVVEKMAIELMVTCKSSVDRCARPQIVCGTLRRPQLVVDGGWWMVSHAWWVMDGGSRVSGGSRRTVRIPCQE